MLVYSTIQVVLHTLPLLPAAGEREGPGDSSGHLLEGDGDGDRGGVGPEMLHLPRGVQEPTREGTACVVYIHKWL